MVFVHLYGYAMDLSKIKSYLKKKIIIIEDYAQALGARVYNKMVVIRAILLASPSCTKKHHYTRRGGMLLFKDKINETT